MRYRGRLINPFLVDIYRLDMAATNAITKPADGVTAGMDPDYREPIIVPTLDRKGKPAREEMPVISIPGQIEPEAFNRQQMTATGDQKGGFFGVTFHFSHLEEMGLVDPSTGIALIAAGDRLGAIRKMDGTLIQEFPYPPGLFALEATPTGFGLGGDRNLLLVKFQSRN